MFRRKKVAETVPTESSEGKLNSFIEKMPWLGEMPFRAATDRRPPKPIIDDLEYVRRILIAWLIGRPVSQVARRVGCSERSVRNVVRNVLYVAEDDLAIAWNAWCELGLLGAIDVMVADQAFSRLEDPDIVQVSAICQICHRLAGVVCMFKPLLAEQRGSQIDLETLTRGLIVEDRLARRRLAQVQSHLLSHFYIGNDAIAANTRRVRQREHEFMQRVSLIPPSRPFKWRTNRLHYSKIVSGHALQNLAEGGEPDQNQLTPVVGGRPTTIYDARRRWKRMIAVS